MRCSRSRLHKHVIHHFGFLFSHRSLGRLKDLVAEHLDHVHYLNDILCLRIDNLNEVLTGHLLNRLFIPLYIYSLVRSPNVSSNSLEVIIIILCTPALFEVPHCGKTSFFVSKKSILSCLHLKKFLSTPVHVYSKM